MQILVHDSAISKSLLDQAESRLRDPRMERVVEQTPDAMRLMLRVVSDPALNVLADATIIVGSGIIDRKTARRLKVTVVHGVGMSAMLESPHVVADTLRALMAPSFVQS